MKRVLQPLWVMALALAVFTTGAQTPVADARKQGETFVVEGTNIIRKTAKYDLVVYGGSPSGVMAAIAASRQGLKVALLSQTKTVGGTMSNGLGATDVIAPGIISGIPLEFFQKVQETFGKPNTWRVTPSVAEKIFQVMLEDAKVDVWLDADAVEAKIVEGSIECIQIQNNTDFCAKQFIDSSYSGDLLPITGTPFKLGREDLFDYADYEEFKINIRPEVVLGESLSEIETRSISSLPFIEHPLTFKLSKVKPTQGMPSFTYRFCVTKENKRPFRLDPADQKYIPAWKVILNAYSKAPCDHCEEDDFHIVSRFWRIGKLHETKWDLNSLNSFTNFPIPDSYFSDPSSREATNAFAARYIESFLAFIQQNDDINEVEHNSIAGFGMCADEFKDNNNVPYEPYIREGRRLVGKYVMKSFDEQTNLSKPDSIGLGKYHLDNKLSIRIHFKNKFYRDYSKFQKSKIYQIPYSITVPESGPKNLLVSVGVSASPLAYGSLRMEPHYMVLGQATGSAAALAIRTNTPVAEISIPELQSLLSGLGQRLVN